MHAQSRNDLIDSNHILHFNFMKRETFSRSESRGTFWYSLIETVSKLDYQPDETFHGASKLVQRLGREMLAYPVDYRIG